MTGELLLLKMDSVVRRLMVHIVSGLVPLYVVNEFPKSGGTWVSQMLSSALNVPFPQNRINKLEPCVMHGHYLSSIGIRNCVVVWRDGRDVMASWYYHCLFVHDRGNALLVDIVRRQLRFEDYENIWDNMADFIEYVFTKQRHPRFSWKDFVKKWYARRGVVHVRYEALHANATDELRRIVAELTGKCLSEERAVAIVDEYSFARQSNRKASEEDKNNFLRKGIVGDWRNHFSRSAQEVFDHYAGEELILLGYERDRGWWQKNEIDPVAVDKTNREMSV